MSARLYHNKRWSEEDDNLLRSMSQAGKSLTLMTVKLNHQWLPSGLVPRILVSA